MSADSADRTFRAIASGGRPDIFTAQGAENLGRENPDAANPYPAGTTDATRFEHGQKIARFLATRIV